MTVHPFTRRAVDLEPSNGRFLLTHARTLRALGMHDEALRAASSVLALEPSHTKALRIRAYEEWILAFLLLKSRMQGVTRQRWCSNTGT